VFPSGLQQTQYTGPLWPTNVVETTKAATLENVALSEHSLRPWPFYSRERLPWAASNGKKPYWQPPTPGRTACTEGSRVSNSPALRKRIGNELRLCFAFHLLLPYAGSQQLLHHIASAGPSWRTRALNPLGRLSGNLPPSLCFGPVPRAARASVRPEGYCPEPAGSRSWHSQPAIQTPGFADVLNARGHSLDYGTGSLSKTSDARAN